MEFRINYFVILRLSQQAEPFFIKISLVVTVSRNRFCILRILYKAGA